MRPANAGQRWCGGEPGGGQVERLPLRAIQRPVVFVAHAGDDATAVPDFEPDPRRRRDVVAAQVPVEEPQLHGAGLARVEGGPLAVTMGVEELLGAGDVLPGAE